MRTSGLQDGQVAQRAHAHISGFFPWREALQDKGGDVASAVASTTIKFRRTVDRVWVILLRFLHFTMNIIHIFVSLGLKILGLQVPDPMI